MMVFKRNKNLQDIIGSHTVKQEKVFKKCLHRLNGNSMPYSSTRPSISCGQIVNRQLKNIKSGH